MATPPQIRKIWGAAREVKLDADQVRDLAEQVSGERSVARLTFDQAGRVIDHLVALGATGGTGARKPSGRRRAANETPMISPGVRKYIADLRRHIGGDWVRDAYFEGACERLIGVRRPRTAGEGARVVEMLKQRLAYQQRS